MAVSSRNKNIRRDLFPKQLESDQVHRHTYCSENDFYHDSEREAGP